MDMQLDRITNRLEVLLRQRLCREVLEYLAANREPQGSQVIADALGKPHHAVQRAVCELIIKDRLAQVGRGGDGKPLYRPVEIGSCDWCGLVSHQLVAGECPGCKALTLGPARPGLARQVC